MSKKYSGSNTLAQVITLVKTALKGKANKATTLAGYGITDAAPSSHVGDTTKHITAAERTAWNGKLSSVPAATASALGGVKIGKGLSISNDGTASVRNICGANLLKDSDYFTEFATRLSWWITSGTEAEGILTRTIVQMGANESPSDLIKTKVVFTKTTSSGNADIRQANVKVKEGHTYTMSCYAKGTGIIRLQHGASSFLTENVTIDTTNWVKISKTFTLSDKNMDTTNGVTHIYFGLAATSIGTVEMCGFMLQEGEVPTMYQPYNPVRRIGNGLKTDNYGTLGQVEPTNVNMTDLFEFVEGVTGAFDTSFKSLVMGNLIMLTFRADTMNFTLEPEGQLNILISIKEPYKSRLKGRFAGTARINTEGENGGNLVTGIVVGGSNSSHYPGKIYCSTPYGQGGNKLTSITFTVIGFMSDPA